MKIEAIVDDSIVTELEKEGFIAKLDKPRTIANDFIRQTRHQAILRCLAKNPNVRGHDAVAACSRYAGEPKFAKAWAAFA